MLEFVVASQAVVIIALVGFVLNQQARLFRAAMSRTPGEYRIADERATRKPAPVKDSGGLDEDVKAVLEAVTPMPYGLGGD